MSLPYEKATSGSNAINDINDIQKMLRAFGCQRFATGEDYESGELFIQFEHRGRQVQLKASARGYTAAWLKALPHGPRLRATKAEHESRALKIGGIAVNSILRDWVKGQVTAIEIGMLTFEAAFLSHILLSNGETVIEHMQHQKLLPQETANG